MTLSVFQLIGILMTLTAIFAWGNQRFIGLPSAVGVMLLALTVSLAMQTAAWLGVAEVHQAAELVGAVDFNHALLDAMLGGLLFAGSMQIRLRDLRREALVVILLTTLALTTSTLLIGAATWGVFAWLNMDIAPVYCFIFGALISPTDPVAVLAILRRAGVPKALETQFTGESLFNDAIAIVMFTLLLQIATGPGHAALDAGHIATLFAEEAVGGLAFGALLGAIGFVLLHGIDEYKVEVIVTLALVTGGYAAAEALNISGPLAVVAAGLVVGNQGRGLAMSSNTREHVDTFWELVDEILNAVLFVLIGLEVLQVPFSTHAILAGLISIPVIVGSRALSVGIPISLLRLGRDMAPHTVKILTWGGLRGGISVALALSLPEGNARDVIVSMTYIVVVFSIGVQGLTIGRLARLASP